MEDAERIKTLYGNVLPGGMDERDMINVPGVGGDEREQPQFVPRAALTRIIKPRVEEILEMVRDRLAASPFASEPRARIILTGGASQLTGLPEAARRILARNVRIGRPLGVSGLPTAAKGPAFSTAVGLMIYPQVAELEARLKAEIETALQQNRIGDAIDTQLKLGTLYFNLGLKDRMENL